MSEHLEHSEAAREVAFAIDKLAQLRAEDALVDPRLVASARDVLAEKLDALVRPTLFVDPSLTKARVVTEPGDLVSPRRRDAFEDLGAGAQCVNCRRVKQPHERACPTCFPCPWRFAMDGEQLQCELEADHDGDEHQKHRFGQRGIEVVKWTEKAIGARYGEPGERIVVGPRIRRRMQQLETENRLLQAENDALREELRLAQDRE